MSRERLIAGYDDYCSYAAWRLLATLDHLDQDLSGKNVLDITCYATTQVIKIAHPTANVYSCDRQLLWQPFLSNDIECARVDLIKDNLPYPDDFFDAIVFTEVLEHIPRSPYEILHEIKRILKPGGTLLISVPNLLWFVHRLQTIVGKSPLAVEVADAANVNSDDPDVASSAGTFGHFREYSAKELEIILDGVGLNVQSISFPHWYPRKYRSRVRRRGIVRSVLATLYLVADAVNPRWRTTILGIATKSKV